MSEGYFIRGMRMIGTPENEGHLLMKIEAKTAVAR